MSKDYHFDNFFQLFDKDFLCKIWYGVLENSQAFLLWLTTAFLYDALENIYSQFIII